MGEAAAGGLGVDGASAGGLGVDGAAAGGLGVDGASAGGLGVGDRSLAGSGSIGLGAAGLGGGSGGGATGGGRGRGDRAAARGHELAAALGVTWPKGQLLEGAAGAALAVAAGEVGGDGAAGRRLGGAAHAAGGLAARRQQGDVVELGEVVLGLGEARQVLVVLAGRRGLAGLLRGGDGLVRARVGVVELGEVVLVDGHRGRPERAGGADRRDLGVAQLRQGAQARGLGARRTGAQAGGLGVERAHVGGLAGLARTEAQAEVLGRRGLDDRLPAGPQRPQRAGAPPRVGLVEVDVEVEVADVGVAEREDRVGDAGVADGQAAPQLVELGVVTPKRAASRGPGRAVPLATSTWIRPACTVTARTWPA